MIRVRREALAAMVRHAHAEAPIECCGLLIGRAGVIEEAMPARNELQSPTRFLVDSADHFAALRLARSTERAIVGAYHSHPRGPERPSPTDAAELNDPTLVQVIVSLATDPPSTAAFVWIDGNFAPIDLVPEP